MSTFVPILRQDKVWRRHATKKRHHGCGRQGFGQIYDLLIADESFMTPQQLLHAS